MTRGAPVRGWLVAGLGAAVLLLLPVPSHAIEQFYSRGAYLWWQPAVTTISNLLPFAWIDVFLVIAVVLTLRRLVLLVALGKRERVWTALSEGGRRLIRSVAAVVILFLLMWGLNYRRVPLEASLPDHAAPAVGDLREVVVAANAIAARTRPRAAGAPRVDDVVAALRAPMNTALARLQRPTLGVPGRPKSSIILTPFFTWAGVNGMVDPLALEILVHPDLLPFERGMSVAHEWAHLSGAADEAEASAIGWLACMNGPPELAYSASVFLIVEAGNALPARTWREISPALDPGVKTDLLELSRRLARQRPQVQRTAFRVYDSYLRANRVEDGVASYSRALTLILSPPLRDALAAYRPPQARP